MALLNTRDIPPFQFVFVYFILKSDGMFVGMGLRGWPGEVEGLPKIKKKNFLDLGASSEYKLNELEY